MDSESGNESGNELASATALLGASRLDIGGWRVRVDDRTVERYTQSGEWAGKTLWQCAVEYADSRPDKVVVTEGGTRQTVREVVDAAAELAAGLHCIGLRAGDVISYQLPNWAEVVTLNLAACLAGLVCNPIVPIYREAEVRYILRDSRSRLFVSPGTFRGFDHAAMGVRLKAELPDLQELVVVRGEPSAVENGGLDLDTLRALGRAHAWTPPLADPNAVKLVLYTSGTTGDPKGVLHTHNTLMSEERAAIDYWRVGERDVVLMPSPVTHVTGYLYALEMPFIARCATVLMERWDAAEAVRLINLHDASLTVGATPFLVELMHLVRDGVTPVPSLRVFASGGAPVPPEIIRRARQTMPGCEVFRVYGSSEAPTVSLGIRAGDDPELGAITDGRIVNNTVRLTSETGEAMPGDGLPEGKEGEVTVRGPEVMVGYTRWEQTCEAFDGDGYFHTGDLGFITHGEFLTISGRKKDLIIRGGENISAKEIEDVLHAHHGIRDAAVVAMTHARLGEGVCAFIVASPGCTVDVATVAELLGTAGLARQKYPEHVEVVSELPRTASGKVQKNVLRDRIRLLLASRPD